MSRANSKSGGTKAAASSDSQKNQGHGHRPTVEDVVSDVLTTVAQAYWAPGQTKLQAYNAQIVEDIYARELSTFDIARVAILEFSQYLEKYVSVFLGQPVLVPMVRPADTMFVAAIPSPTLACAQLSLEEFRCRQSIIRSHHVHGADYQ